VLAVYSVAKRAVERARAGEGPTLIEAKAPRFYDHYGVGGSKTGTLGAFGLPYRSDREVHASIANDPIPKLRRLLVRLNILTNEKADQIENDVKALVDTSIELARAASVPKQDAGLNHVYSGHRVAAAQFVT
jgi:TPP-dependent pyruvate/acetoin dehydrogenase alpha subunit